MTTVDALFIGFGTGSTFAVIAWRAFDYLQRCERKARRKPEQALIDTLPVCAWEGQVTIHNGRTYKFMRGSWTIYMRWREGKLEDMPYIEALIEYEMERERVGLN